MKISSFLKLVEIQTKLASVIPFALGSIYAYYRFGSFNIWNFAVMFLSLLSFDMATTTINNLLDYKKAKKKHGYNYESHNAIVKYNLTEYSVYMTLAVLLIAAVALGIMLVVRTNIIVLLIGMLSFGIGILYTFGPIPISRTPFGEIMSGFFMGFVIVFLSAYIHIYSEGLIGFSIENYKLLLNINILESAYIFLFSLPLVCGIANIMLANNTCDIDDDLENRRYTLPIFIGKKNALKVFKALYYIAYIDIVAMVLLKLVPFTLLFVLITFVPVKKNISLFEAVQTKKDTFSVSVKNFMMIGASQFVVLSLTVLIVELFR